ncbi:MAG TPA: hypothetical protein VHY22_17010 [Chthoniobacteraceae bacterium]|nr:hypothetical protein [Chthoniobacteraceae bacterium]
MPSTKKPNRYAQLIETIFHSHYRRGAAEVEFQRHEFESTARNLDVRLPKNLGDLIYSFRYRVPLPESIRALAPTDKEWIIRPAGRSKYQFALVKEWVVAPNPHWSAIKIPDATPGLISKYALSDEQALLAKLRYNRLIDIFTGITCYSLQNHLRTTVAGMGQVEIDEIYVGVDRSGAHYVVPIQAKGGTDKLSVVQIEQDFAMAEEKFAGLMCRSIGAQFMNEGAIALFEFEQGKKGVTIRRECHYQLVPPNELSPEDLAAYRQSQSEFH